VIALADESASQELATWLASHLDVGDVLCLRGDLGAGKTTLARFLIHAMQSPDAQDSVTSPTFTLVQPYDVQTKAGHKATLYHFDLYRVEEESELEEAGLDDALQHGICVIEWPDIASNYLPAAHLTLELQQTGQSGRTCQLYGTGKWQRLITEAQHALD